ncbi:transposase family protein [Streptomyces sp. NPDC001781]
MRGPRARVIAHPSGLHLSPPRCGRCGGGWPIGDDRSAPAWRLNCSRQALTTLAHLRCGHTFADLAARFRVGLPHPYRRAKSKTKVRSNV